MLTRFILHMFICVFNNKVLMIIIVLHTLLFRKCSICLFLGCSKMKILSFCFCYKTYIPGKCKMQWKMFCLTCMLEFKNKCIYVSNDECDVAARGYLTSVIIVKAIFFILNNNYLLINDYLFITQYAYVLFQIYSGIISHNINMYSSSSSGLIDPPMDIGQICVNTLLHFYAIMCYYIAIYLCMKLLLCMNNITNDFL